MITTIQEQIESAPRSIAPKVSVLMITYNHEKYVATAIESVLTQKTTFDVEIVIGEDCSTDCTREIVLDFAQRYPSRIRLLLPEGNLGMHKNFVETYKACDGEYIAMLEGDDYWTEPNKLQQQVDLLDAHSEWSACAHNAARFSEEENRLLGDYQTEVLPALLTLEKMLEHDWLPTCSLVLRRRFITDFPDWFYGLYACDWSMLILAAGQGPIAYLDQVMAVYREHKQGVWTGLPRIHQLKELIRARKQFDSHLGYRYKNILRDMASSEAFGLALLYEHLGDMDNAKASLWQSITMYLTIHYRPKLIMLRLLMRLYFPKVYKIAINLVKREAIKSVP